MQREDLAFVRFPDAMPMHYHRVVRAGQFVFVAGQIPARDGQIVHTGDIEAQTRVVYENLANMLSDAGLTLDDVIKETVYLADRSLLPQVAKVRAELYERFPANTTVFGSEGEGYAVEIDAIALAP